MIILNIFEVHPLTLTAAPNLTPIKQKTQSKRYFYDSLSRPLHKQPRRRFVKETFCYRRRFVKETFCLGDVVGIDTGYRRFVWRRFVWRRFVEETFCRGDVLYVGRL
jgi:hypothetical protein